MDITVGITLSLEGTSIPDFRISMDEEFKAGDLPDLVTAETMRAVQIVGNKVVRQVMALTGHGSRGEQLDIVAMEESESEPIRRRPSLRHPTAEQNDRVESAPTVDRRWAPEAAEKWRAAAEEAVTQAARLQKRIEQLERERDEERQGVDVRTGIMEHVSGAVVTSPPNIDSQDITGVDQHGVWHSKHSNGFRAPEVVHQMEAEDPTQKWERHYLDEDNEGQFKKNPWPAPADEDELLADDDDVPTE